MKAIAVIIAATKYERRLAELRLKAQEALAKDDSLLGDPHGRDDNAEGLAEGLVDAYAIMAGITYKEAVGLLRSSYSPEAIDYIARMQARRDGPRFKT